MPTPTFDVVILGAGAAGSATARAAAQAGLSVLCVDKRPIDKAGAHWINAVPTWCFEQAGVPMPTGPELRKVSHRTTMVAGWGPTHVRFPATGMLDVDMALLIQRLRDDARAAGARFQERVSVRQVTRAPGANQIHTDQGDFIARTVVDATGIGGLGLLRLPDSQPHVCAAAQQQRKLVDRQAALRFLADNNAEEGDNLIFSAIEGGYSIVNICVEGDEVGLLTGSVPALGRPPGHTILERFAEQQPWIGAALRKGAGPIPLQPPLRPALGDIAAIGDQGGHVYAMHGSSIGAAMVAGQMLARTLTDGGRAEDWGRRWMRTHGGNFAGAYLFFRFTMSMTPEELAGLMESGLLTPDRMSAGLLQKTPKIRIKDLPGVVRGAVRERRTVGKLAPTLVRMGVAEALYAAYPGPQPWWESRIKKLLR